ncbi:MAG: hypothetical protein DDT31_01400 [Syntrophomonadaceae bacterium]|nr:hypothetical protein [Bacillota bacterium]
MLPEVSSWTDYGMDWSNPDSSRLEYSVALYRAIQERREAFLSSNIDIKIFSEYGAGYTCYVNNFLQKEIVNFVFLTGSSLQWFHPDILTNLMTTTPDNYRLFVGTNYVPTIKAAIGLEDFSIPDNVNKRTMDKIYRFCYEVLNLMYVYWISTIIHGSLHKFAESDLHENIFVAENECNARFANAPWSWKPWFWSSRYESSFHTRMDGGGAPVKYRFSRSSSPRRIIFRNIFGCLSNCVLAVEYSAKSGQTYHHPAGTAPGVHIIDFPCVDKYFTGNVDSFEFDPNYYFYPGGEGYWGFTAGALRIFQRMNVDGGFKFKNW